MSGSTNPASGPSQRPMATPFPAPSPLIVDALDQLRLAALSPPEDDKELRRLAMLPHPWDPAACPPELRCVIYTWLDDVVAWINEDHTWRVDRVIPNCWPDHPHIVHELAVVACLRFEADYAITAAVLEEWHRYTLTMFLDRITVRVGATGCPPGKHQPHPGQSRNTIYRGANESRTRRGRRYVDQLLESPQDW